MKRNILFLTALLFIFSCARQSPESTEHEFLSHDFLHHMINEMHDSPMQQKFRAIRPMPAGVVYLQRPGEGEEEIRQHFRLMRELGFKALKQLQAVPGFTNQQLEMMALEEGIIPWWFGEGGWEEITEELLGKLGIPIDAGMETIRTHPKMLEHQFEVMAERIRRTEEWVKSGNADWYIAGRSVAYEPDIAYPFLFNYVEGEEWRTQRQVRQIIKNDFSNAPDGLPGNDDVGTLSAWLMYAMMGFYPDCPATCITSSAALFSQRSP